MGRQKWKIYVFLEETIDFPLSEGGRNGRPRGNCFEHQCALSPRPPIPFKDRTFPIPYPPITPTRRPALRGRRIREGCAHFRRPQGSIAVCTGVGVRRKLMLILGTGLGNSIPRETNFRAPKGHLEVFHMNFNSRLEIPTDIFVYI